MTNLVVSFAIATAVVVQGEALAQTPPPARSVPGALLRLELAAPPGVLLRIRPEPIGGEVYDFITCPPACRLTVYPGRYLVEGEPPSYSGLRAVDSTAVDVLNDARIDVAAGNRGEHDWGVGLTIGGGILFGLGTLLYAYNNAPFSPHRSLTDSVSYTMMGVGAPAIIGGIYLLVDSRNRVVVAETRKTRPYDASGE